MQIQKTDNTFFILDSGRLYRKENNLHFEKYLYDEENNKIDSQKITIPINSINELYILARVELDTETISLISKHNILVHIFNSYQTFKANIYPKNTKSAFVFMNQLDAYRNEKRLHIAKEITRGRVANALNNLSKYRVKTELKQKDILESIDKVDNIQALMGIEGNFQKRYLSHFNDIIKDKKSFEFTIRSKRPPLDKINSFISYTNTRIYNISLAEIYKTELDPRISFLHEPNFKTVALHLDIAEIFKPYIGDNIIFSMLNNKEIDAKSFTKENGLYRFSKESLKKIELKFINKLQESITINNQTITIRQLIRKEINKIKKYIVEDIEYVSFKGEKM